MVQRTVFIENNWSALRLVPTSPPQKTLLSKLEGVGWLRNPLKQSELYAVVSKYSSEGKFHRLPELYFFR